MVLKLRKTLSDVHDRVKRLSVRLDVKSRRPTSCGEGVENVDKNTDKNNNNIVDSNDNNSDDCYAKGITRKSVSKSKRRVTVTGCDGHQVVITDKSFYYEDFTETTIDKYGVKTTSFCSSHL